MSPVVLLKFIVDNSDPNSFAQEGDEDVWFKKDTRKQLGDYKKKNYRLPEIVISRPIPFGEISSINFIPNLAAE